MEGAKTSDDDHAPNAATTALRGRNAAAPVSVGLDSVGSHEFSAA